METWRQKAGILVMVLCLGMVLAALWYCLFLMPGREGEKGGTLVQMMEEERANLAENAMENGRRLAACPCSAFGKSVTP